MTPDAEMALLKARNGKLTAAIKVIERAVNANCRRMAELQPQLSEPSLDEANQQAEAALAVAASELRSLPIALAEPAADPVTRTGPAIPE